jgi:RecB family exonuclease
MRQLTQGSRPDSSDGLPKPSKLGPVSSWSYSSLKVFEECPYRTYIQKVKRIPEPSSPAADRGTAIHKLAEDYVKGELDKMPSELNPSKFKDDFEELRQLYTEAKVEIEGEWGFNTDWNPTGWMSPDTWARIKLDAMVLQSDTSARVIDYKTGKKFGNEIPHSQQCLLYAIGTFFKYPVLEFVQTELWYLDKGEKTIRGFNREEAMQFAPGYHSRAVKMTTCTEFSPTPSNDSCRWCPYGKGEHPECRWGVR